MTTDIERATAPETAPARREVASQYTLWGLNDRASYAKLLAGANEILPSGIKGGSIDQVAAKVFLALETGDMLGLHPMAAVGGIDIIEGNPTISPQLALGLIKKNGHRYRIEETGAIETGDFKVTVTLWRTDDPEPMSKSYSMRDALRAGLLDSYEPDGRGDWIPVARSAKGNALNWEKIPADMCQWRAVGRLMRAYAPDIMLGVSYFPEELEAHVDASGVRTEVITDETVAEYIARIKAIQDKADMETIYHEIIAAEAWIPKIEGEFVAHLSTLTVDSRPPKPGRPGNTGDPAIDNPTESPTTSTEPGHPQEDSPHPPVSAEPDSQAVTEAHSDAPSDEDAPPVDHEPRIEQSIDEADAAERAEYQADRAVPHSTVGMPTAPVRDADGMIPPGAAIAAARGERKPFDPSALYGG